MEKNKQQPNKNPQHKTTNTNEPTTKQTTNQPHRSANPYLHKTG